MSIADSADRYVPRAVTDFNNTEETRIMTQLTGVGCFTANWLYDRNVKSIADVAAYTGNGPRGVALDDARLHAKHFAALSKRLSIDTVYVLEQLSM